MIDDLMEHLKIIGFVILAALLALGFIFGIIWVLQSTFGPSDEQKAEMRVPQLLSESDGCRVYKFVDDGTHYFTRCGEQVDTVRHYTESCGKNCTRRRTESIATEGNK
jgi:hypothetical protein